MSKYQLRSPVVTEIVEELLEKYVGGVKFFDNVDAVWRTPRGISAVYDLVGYAVENYRNHTFIGSGRFGMFLHNAFPSTLMSYHRLLLVTGGLRTTAPMDDLSYVKDEIKGRDFVFLDDSFYSGRTRDLIKGEIERLGGRLVKSVVIYDGSRNKDPEVEAMFRYYDHYNPDPTRANPNVKVGAGVPRLLVPEAHPAPLAQNLRQVLQSFLGLHATPALLMNMRTAILGWLSHYNEMEGIGFDLEAHLEIIVTNGSPKAPNYFYWCRAPDSDLYLVVTPRTQEGKDYLLRNWGRIVGAFD